MTLPSADFVPQAQYKELLLGCGHRRAKELSPDGGKDWKNMVALDCNPAVDPDVVHDLDVFPYPFSDDEFDEIHAYEVLEHCGAQGDWRFFFAQFDEIWRILKPGGYFLASVPMWDSPWAWSDPGHRRVISEHSLIFLSRENYEHAEGTPLQDYRNVYRGDFSVEGIQSTEHRFYFVLRAIK